MKTTIENAHRIYVVNDRSGETVVCNLMDIPKAVKTLKFESPYVIYELLNAKLIRCTKEDINFHFQNNGVDFRIRKFIA